MRNAGFSALKLLRCISNDFSFIIWPTELIAARRMGACRMAFERVFPTLWLAVDKNRSKGLIFVAFDSQRKNGSIFN